MKVRKFSANTYDEAVLQAKIDIGGDVQVWHQRTVKTGGFWGFFAKKSIEIIVSPKVRPRIDMAPMPQQPESLSSPRLRPAQPVARVYEDKLNQTAPVSASPRPYAAPAAAAVPVVMPEIDENRRESLRRDIASLHNDLRNLEKFTRGWQATQEKPGIQTVKSYLRDMELHSSHIARLAEDLENRISPDHMSDTCYIRRRLRQTLAESIKSDRDIVLDKKPKIIALAGPTGVGKTVSIAKLAARNTLRPDFDVAMITLDTYRLGATDQLKMYGELIDVPTEIAFSTTEFRNIIDRHQDKHLILVDTAGKSQRNAKELQELKSYMDVVPEAEVHLVMSSLIKYQDMLDTYERFSMLNIDRLAFTKMDECALFGPMISLLMHTGLPLSYLTNGQVVPHDLYYSTPEELSALLLPEPEKAQNS